MAPHPGACEHQKRSQWVTKSEEDRKLGGEIGRVDREGIGYKCGQNNCMKFSYNGYIVRHYLKRTERGGGGEANKEKTEVAV